jgi:pimeloyl-ACP methyl ester carboxylesterase
MNISIDGKQVYVYTNNKEIDPTRQSVVFIHGAGFDHSVWTLFARHFSRHNWNVLAIDLPGHGRSEGDSLTSIEAMATWIIAVIDSCGIAQSALVGHSMGSLIALETGARLGTRASRVVLIGSISPMPVSDPILDATANKPNTAHSMLTSFSFSKNNLMGGNPNPGMWMVSDSMRRYEDEQQAALELDMRACNQYQRGLEAAGEITAPTLMLHGDADRLTPLKATQPLLKALIQGRLDVVPGSGHSLMVEDPNHVLDQLKLHLG